MKPIIKIENLSKQYRLGTIGTRTLSHDLNRWWHRIRGRQDPYLKIGRSVNTDEDDNSEYVWALKNINLEIMPGEVLGIIGKNGAGKSTLLKVLSKVTGPTTGCIHFNGRIGSLLEVGTGFHDELTGKENIFLNGAILGMTKSEIRGKLDEIIDFSGCERYIDTPVKRYSSGMKVRLGFAVAAHLEPEILVVDEVLAVGDAEFQKKAVGKMQDVSKNDGRTVLFVSHNMGSIEKLCINAIILDYGEMKFHGNVNKAIDEYIKTNQDSGNKDLSKLKERKGNGSIKIQNIVFLDSKDNQIKILRSGSNIKIKISFISKLNLKKVAFRVLIISKENNVLLNFNNYFTYETFKINIGTGDLYLTIPKFPLPAGIYFMHITVVDNNQLLDEISFARQLSVEDGDFYGTGMIPHLKQGVLVEHFWELSK
ncbi:MAG: ABC transporter ATP-binding protein [Bacteroidales bacterium]|nr:ABC transporter ATP-binding protein [Bacteroidales bacterium]